MDNILTFIIGAIFAGGGVVLAAQAWRDNTKNFLESVLFGSIGAGLGLFLCYIAIFGPPG